MIFEYEFLWVVLVLGRIVGVFCVKFGVLEILGCGCFIWSLGFIDWVGEGVFLDVKIIFIGIIGWWGLDWCLVFMYMGW